MERIRGFKLKHRVAALFRFGNRRNRVYSGFRRFDPPASCRAKPISWFFSCLKAKAKSLCCAKRLPGFSGRDYVPLNDRRLAKDKAAAAAVPKGHMAIYVGQKDGNFHRFLVPVLYFNHPLFGELLREAEEEFGFNHPGGITIPCRVSEFENVQTQIAAAARGCRKLMTWKKAS